MFNDLFNIFVPKAINSATAEKLLSVNTAFGGLGFEIKKSGSIF